MRNLIPLLVTFGILILLDLYVFKALKVGIGGWEKPLWRNTAIYGFWITTILGYLFLGYMMSAFGRTAPSHINYYPFFMSFGLALLIIMPKIIVVIFHGIDDLTLLLRKLIGSFTTGDSTGNVISRWDFITKIGWAVAAIPFISILYGISKGRFAFRIEKNELAFDHLPDSFSGMRVVHISDIHIGSFFDNHEPVVAAIDKINSLNADIICFTGDMVNNIASELDGWVPVLSKLKAKHGKFSVLGNHDYGDYIGWPTDAEKAQNLETLKALHGEMGFKLLLNEKVDFNSPSGDSIEIIGIENWGAGGFSKYGDLKKAMAGSDEEKFQLLLSHDPSHWDAEVLDHTKIDLTLAGHTHGMQFGIEIPGMIKWSPVKYRYPRWGGLYTEKNQHIYVNRGFGYIGFPGRVGMAPEITVLDLKRA